LDLFLFWLFAKTEIYFGTSLPLGARRRSP